MMISGSTAYSTWNGVSRDGASRNGASGDGAMLARTQIICQLLSCQRWRVPVYTKLQTIRKDYRRTSYLRYSPGLDREIGMPTMPRRSGAPGLSKVAPVALGDAGLPFRAQKIDQ
jgi:hypothetical protein